MVTIYSNTFYRVSVKALIRNKQNEVLVLKENQDTWSLPGGGLDHGEDPKLGILRELKEELSVEAAEVSDIATVKTFYLAHKQAWLLWVVYEVKIDTEAFTYGDGVTESQYIDVADLKKSRDAFEQMVYEVAVS